MDSISQLLLGGAVTAAIAPARHRRAALLAGAALGTLPDLDGLVIALLTDDPVRHMTWHRSASHSLLVLPWLGWAIWQLCRSRGTRVAAAPMRWFWAIQAALLTHPLLDAFTVYGTQLLWPLPLQPTMWSSMFIIDPLYTIWLLPGVCVAWVARDPARQRRALVLALALSSTYLGWSLLAKHWIEQEADAALAESGLESAPRFSVPMPLNTLLWRVVAMTPRGYVEGERSLLDDCPMVFREYPSEARILDQVRDIPAVSRLRWFNHGFMKAEVTGDGLLLSDLRMGLEPDYIFRFIVAERVGEAWQPVAPQQLPWPSTSRGQLASVWRRIREQPTEGATRCARSRAEG